MSSVLVLPLELLPAIGKGALDCLSLLTEKHRGSTEGSSFFLPL